MGARVPVNETWHVYAYRASDEIGSRAWRTIAWAGDEPLAHALFLQAAATTTSHLRLVHDDGSASPDPGFDRSVIAERLAR